MIKRHLILYFSSRALAAAGNLAAIAIFTRLAGPDVYGHYVVIFAAALVVSGFSVQWLRYAFFAHYRSDEDRDFFASFVLLLALSCTACIAVTLLALRLNGTDLAFALSALMVGLSVAIFEAVTEVCRTRLKVERAALGVMLKAGLVLVAGTLALEVNASAVALAAGVALAHLVAALPTALGLGPLVGGRPTYRQMRTLVVFGWPLMLSFGIGALAQGTDRFFLAGLEGAAAIGTYGALSDLVRASFMVLGESVSLATVPLARRQFVAGDAAQATRTLALAFRLILLVGTFMTAGFLVFAPILLPIVFPPAFLEGARTLLPPILVAAFLLVLRNVYLAQVIYFTKASRLELASALVLAVVNASLCALLIPRHGALGAALAFLGGQIAAGLLFLLANRGSFAMPTPWRPVLGMAVLGTVLTVAGEALVATHWPLPLLLPLEAALFLAALAVAALGLGLRPAQVASDARALLARLRPAAAAREVRPAER